MRVLAAFVSTLAVASLTGWASGSGVARTVTCRSIVVPGGTYEFQPQRVVLGVVDVPPPYISQSAEPAGTARFPFWSKAGMVVRADSPPVLVSVPRAWRNRVAIGWGNVGASSTLRFASCPPSSSLGEWNPYAGGFLLRARAACFPLVFRVGERAATVRFGIGKRC